MPNEIMSLVRRDIGNLLFHFTREAPPASGNASMLSNVDRRPYSVLKKILRERTLKGSSRFIRGSHKCVCFTESPISELSSVFAMANAESSLEHKYQPYGIAIKKSWLFERGARPVIYQKYEEYDQLGEALQYRHVTYDPAAEIDFTWEREWRIKTEALMLPSSDMLVIVPTATEAFELMQEFSSSEPNSFDDEGNPDPVGGVYTYPNILAVSLDIFGIET